MRTKHRYFDNLVDLRASVLSNATQAQRDKVAKFEELGWYVYGGKAEGAVQMIFMSHEDSKGPAAVYPNGDFVRAIKGKTKVEYNWVRARAAYAEVNA